MATYNGSQFIHQSISSILSQTFGDLELIVVNDCSTDDTGMILSSILDPRVRVLHNNENIGVVQSRNRCLMAARGRYVAMLDHDDLSRPTRLSKQVAYLNTHPSTVLVGTAAHTLCDSVLAPTRHPPRASPLIIRWLLHLTNPLVCSSVMVRASAVRQLGTFMREDYKYADDYDLYHRLLALGDVARLDEPLTIYRLHAANAFRQHEDIMNASALKVLAPAYQRWFGDGAERAASLVLRHMSAGNPVPDAATLVELRNVLARLDVACTSESGMGDAEVAALRAYSDELWRRMARATANNGIVPWVDMGGSSVGRNFSAGDIAHLVLGQVPLRKQVKQFVYKLKQRSPALRNPGLPVRLLGANYEPFDVDEGGVPTLFVVVDTEAEFDWTQPFARNLTSVTAIDDIERGQAVFDDCGLRPIYVVDYPVASQDSSVRRLRAMLERDACYVGAHLHPWTTPPFYEQLSNFNSYPGNLAPDLEEQKLAALLEIIRERLGICPKFYKAGRYGIGPETAKMLVRNGIEVDLSILPSTNLSDKSGPDFSEFTTSPYWTADGQLLTVPMTRGNIGLLPSLGNLSEAIQRVRGLQWIQMQPVLSRLRVTDTITLTPEGVTAAEQIRLIKFMLRQGKRMFVMHYHSPSLSPGHTPYVRTVEDAKQFVQRIQDVCRFFFDEVGGMPGYPPDLLEIVERRRSAVRQITSDNCPIQVTHALTNPV